MDYKFKIDDEEQDLKHGNFDSFYASEMNLSLFDNQYKIQFNTTIHKTFLVSLISKITNLYKDDTPFIIETFGNAFKYQVKKERDRIKIKQTDELDEKTSLVLSFDSQKFYICVKKLYKEYIDYVLLGNDDIVNNEEYKLLLKKYKLYGKSI